MRYAEQVEREERRIRAFQGQADAICDLIVNTDYPWVDIAIQIEKLRDAAEQLFPDKLALFEMIYISRFDRLWKQWRGADDGP